MSDKEIGEKDFSAMRKIEMNFRITMYGIKYFISNLGPVADARDETAKKTGERIKEGIRSILSDVPTSAKRDEKLEEQVSIKEDRLSSTVNEIISLVKDYDYAGANVALDNELHRGLLLKSSFMMMIASLDFLISDILHCYFEKYPQALNDDMVLSLGDLKKCNDINEAIHILIDQKVEAVLFKNFTKQIMYFENELKITANKIISWDLINEAYQRRNILVHNNGIVNRRYLKSVGALPGFNEVKIGERLNVSEDYFFPVYWEILAGGIVLGQNCWRKWFKEDLSGADSTLIDCINRELLQQAVIPASMLCIYSREIETGSEEARFGLNSLRCQSIKMLGLKEKLTKEIKKLENSASCSKRLAVIAALKDDKEAFYEHVKNAVKNGEMRRDDFELAAIYEDFHRDVDFKTRLDGIFKLCPER
jgi:hypothetical protein